MKCRILLNKIVKCRFLLIYFVCPGIVQGPTKTTAEEDEFDLSQHDGRNLAFQMKNSNVQPSPCPNGVPPRGLM